MRRPATPRAPASAGTAGLRPASLRVGLTGTFGAGKSTALAELKRLGARVASADEAAHRLSRRGGSIARAVRRTFGARLLLADGSVDRAGLARRVFSDPRARRKLERVTHPLIIREMERQTRGARGGVAVADAPLLFEAGMGKAFDLTVTVSAPRAQALRRVRARDRVTRAAAFRRLAAQWPAARKEAAADVVWRNDGRRSDFVKRVRQYYRAWDLIARSAQKR